MAKNLISSLMPDGIGVIISTQPGPYPDRLIGDFRYFKSGGKINFSKARASFPFPSLPKWDGKKTQADLFEKISSM